MATEVIVAIIGIIGTLIGAAGYVLKRNADAAATSAQAELQDAKTRLAQVQSADHQVNSLMKLFEQQIVINKQHTEQSQVWAQALREKEQKDESNYQTLKKALDGHTSYLGSLVVEGNNRVLTAVAGIPRQIDALSMEALKLFAAEIGAVLANQFTIHNLSQDLFPFPDSADPGWQEAFIRPITGRVVLRKRPLYDDQAELKAPGAVIKMTGETVRVITGRIKGWLIVHKKENGDPPAWGWLPEYTVRMENEVGSDAGSAGGNRAGIGGTERAHRDHDQAAVGDERHPGPERSTGAAQPGAAGT